MSSVFKLLAVSFVFLCSLSARADDLRVCADPGNLPYSNSDGSGFENEIAKLAAKDLGRSVQFVWAPERGDYLRKTLNAGVCDVVMSLPSASDEAAVTHPYYRSSYVFVTRKNHPAVRSFDDPSLRNAHIGVNVIGHDSASSPAAQILFDRGMASNIRWYRLVPNYAVSDSTSTLITAVENGDVDVAIVWGPVAGYLAKRSATDLRIVPVSPPVVGNIPLVFDMSMAVRREDHALLNQLNSFLERNRIQIADILKQYGMPTVPTPILSDRSGR